MVILLISLHSIRQTNTIERHCSAFSTNCVNRIAIRRGETSAREDRKRRGFEGDGRSPAGQQKSDAAAASSVRRVAAAHTRNFPARLVAIAVVMRAWLDL